MTFPITVFLNSLLVSFPFLISPGPNNLLAVSLGKQYGYKKNSSFILGVCVGAWLCYLFLLILGDSIFTIIPWLPPYIIFFGSLYMLYLSWKTIRSGKKSFLENKKSNKPLGFINSFILQWVNPKAITCQLTIITLYRQPKLVTNILIFSALSLFVFLSLSFWLLFGKTLSPYLKRNQPINFIFHLLLGGSLALISLYFTYKAIASLFYSTPLLS